MLWLLFVLYWLGLGLFVVLFIYFVNYRPVCQGGKGKSTTLKGNDFGQPSVQSLNPPFSPLLCKMKMTDCLVIAPMIHFTFT